MGHHLDDSTVKRPQFHYRASTPIITPDGDTRPCTAVLNVRETIMWCAPCGDEGNWTQMKRVIHAPYMAEIWHKDNGPNIATGKLLGDRKQLQRAFREGEDRQQEVTGYRPNYVEASPAELTHGDAGLKSQHDRAVAEHRKESRGRFVF